MMLMRSTWVDYTPKKDTGDDPTVRLCGRSAGGERVVKHVRGCRPHCYVKAAQGDATRRVEDAEVLSVEEGYKSYDGVPLAKVTVAHPKQVNAIDDEFATWEADIPFYRRATWDYGLSGYLRVPPESNIHVDDIETDIDPESVDPIEPRVCIGDIEVVSEESKSFDRMQEEVEDPIMAVSLYDTYSEEFVLGVVDPEASAEGLAVKSEMREHWDDHDLAEQFVDDAQITYLQESTEAGLLNSVIRKIEEWRPDLISGWNWIDFDHAYLTERMRKVDDVTVHDLSEIGGVGGRSVETVIKGLPGFDELAAYDDKVSWSENRSLSLEYVANEELDIGKIDAVDVATAYEQDRARLAAYNLLDVQLCVALTEKHGIEEFYLDLADLTGIQVYDAFYEKRLVDGWIASRADDDQILPNQTERDIPEPAGGLVLSPSQGVTKDVAVLDLKSLYPSGMISCNISPETMTDDPEEADVVIPGVPEKADDVGGSIDPSDINWDDWDDDLPWSLRPKGFTLGGQGIIAEAAEGPFEERGRYKALRDEYEPSDPMHDVYDRKQGSVKVVHNSMYGVLNSDYYRLATPGMGDAITGVSRYVLWRAAQKCEELGYEVIYGDTDSVLITVEGDRSMEDKILDVKGVCTQLNDHMASVADDLGIPADHPHIDDDLHGTDQHCWVFEFEKFYESFLQAGSKKRYCGRLAWKEGKEVSDVDVTGFESERSDVPEITAETQRGVIDLVLAGKPFAVVSQYVRERIEEVRRMGAIEKVGIPKSIGKPLDEYPNMPRVRAVEHSNRHLGKEYGPGDTPWMFYIRRTPTGVEGTDVVAIDWNEEIPEGYEVDEEKTIIKAFESALSPIVEEVGWTFSEIRSGKQATAAEEAVEVTADPFDSSGDDGEPSEGSDEDWEGAEAW